MKLAAVAINFRATMRTLQDIILFVVFLGVLVTVHELGHFLAAKWAGVKVLKFSVGFGPRIFGVTRGETEYQIAAIPLGGFVRMAGELPGDEESTGDDPRGFQNAVWWKRAIIVIAGPAFNLIFPVFAYYVVLLGDHQAYAARVGWVEPDLPAAQAGIQPGDLLTHVNGKAIASFDQISPALEGVFDRPIPVKALRDGKVVEFTLSPKKLVEKTVLGKFERGLLGIVRPPRPAIVGVPSGSIAEQAGVKTFDRVLRMNGEPVRDEVQFAQMLAGAEGSVELTLVRSTLHDVGGAAVVVPSLVTVRLEKQPGSGLQTLGLESADVYVWTVFPGGPADRVGIRRGDKIVSVNDRPMKTWLTMQSEMQNIERESFRLVWRSGDTEKSADLRQEAREERDELKNRFEIVDVGMWPRPAFQGAQEILAQGAMAERVTIHLGPIDAMSVALEQVPQAIRDTALAIARILTGAIPFENVGSPIMLFQVASKSAEAGADVFLRNMALVSVNLGLVNLLPIPILDGFGLLAAIWEGIRRRPIPARTREVANMIGFMMLVLLMLGAFWNDIARQLR